MAKTARKTKKVSLGKAGSWTSHPGRLHRELGVSTDKTIPMAKKRAALKSSSPQTRRDARAAIGYAAMDHSGSKGKRSGMHSGRGSKRAAKGHDAIGDHPGYALTMKKKK